MIRVFHQDEELIREVVKMTEPILELEFDKYLRERDEAREQVQKVTQELEKYKDEREKDKELIAILQQQLTELQKNET